MRNLKYVLPVVIPLAFALSLATDFRLSTKGSIEGYVMDNSGPPIPRASIQAFNIIHGGFSAAISEPNGHYQIVDLASGRYSLWVEAKGYASEWIPVLIVEEGQATKKDIRLKREFPTEETRFTH